MIHRRAFGAVVLLIVWLPTSVFTQNGPNVIKSDASKRPASYVAVSVIGTFAGQLGYKVPGVGGVFSAGVALPAHLYLTDDLEVVAEHKRGFDNGRTISNVVGLQYHFDGNVFARAGLQIADHTNSGFSKTVARAQIGGGWQKLGYGHMPIVSLDVAAVVPLSDKNRLYGVKASLSSFYEFPRSPFGLKLKVVGTAASARDSFAVRRGWANYMTAEAGFFINLSAINGS